MLASRGRRSRHRGSCVSYDDDGADAGAAAAVFRLLRWRQARGAAARVTAARWGRGFGEARLQACTLFGRGEASQRAGIHHGLIFRNGFRGRAPHVKDRRRRGGGDYSGARGDASGSTASRPSKIFALARWRRQREEARSVRHRRAFADASTCITTIKLAPRRLFFSREVRRGRVHLLRAGTTLRGQVPDVGGELRVVVRFLW